ncbi:MAG: DUF4276 family protein [Lactococcus chungangensis]|nr:DUF4276 family protein [Lactococcus chungangensis]
MFNFVCMLEEPSAKEMLKVVLPKLLPNNVNFRYIVFEGKQDLEKQLEGKLRGWQAPNSYFLILRDQDSGNCVKLKDILIGKVKNSKKTENTIIRIACHELESFYLGDLEAVEKGLKIKNLAKMQNNKRYRNPDHLTNASEVLTKLSGSTYQKIQGSRMIAPFLKLDGSNRSASFNVLISGVKKIHTTIQSCPPTGR